MSDVSTNIVVQPNNINVVVGASPILVTPTATSLNIFTGGIVDASPAGGTNTQIQYNNGGLLGGVTNVTYNGSNLSLGNVATIKITGGTNGYVLQTDGTGNLDWTLMSGNGGGNGTPGGSNTQIQYNDSGAFGGNAGFTFNEVTGIFTSPFLAGNGNGLSSIVGANVSGAVAFATTANTVAGVNVSGAVAFATIANAVAGANVSGAVSYAVYATTVGTVTNNAQPNITSVGTLSSLSVTGNTTVGNIIGPHANGNSNVNIPAANGNITFGVTGVSNALVVSNIGIVTGNVNATNVTATGTTTLTSTFVKPIQESVTIVGTAAGANYTYNLIDQLVVYNTANANANLTLNFVGNSTITANTFISNANSIVASYLFTTGSGANAFSITNVNIDGAARTISWAGNTVPITYQNSTMSYTFNLIKTGANTYKVMASTTRYG